MSLIHVVGSSSQGNGYIVESGNQSLIIECGCPFDNYLKKMEYEKGFRKIVGGIVTHKHFDHLKKETVKKFVSRGIPIYSHDDVCAFDNNVKMLRFGVKNKIGGFYVQMFKTFHNVPNVGYLIETPSGERIVFATDTTQVPYRFKNIHCFMVECNYDEDVIFDNMMEDEWNHSHNENHMSIESCIEFCKNNFTTSLQSIILIHMSEYNINPIEAVEKLKDELSFFNITYAQSNKTYEINKTEF